jgi:hypothetical protein
LRDGPLNSWEAFENQVRIRPVGSVASVRQDAGNREDPLLRQVLELIRLRLEETATCASTDFYDNAGPTGDLDRKHRVDRTTREGGDSANTGRPMGGDSGDAFDHIGTDGLRGAERGLPHVGSDSRRTTVIGERK